MKMEILRSGIRITPESEQDVAYLEDTLGIVSNNTSIVSHNTVTVRHVRFAVASSLAYVLIPCRTQQKLEEQWHTTEDRQEFIKKG